MNTPLRIVILGLTLSSSWGNGHATTYRALIRALQRCGHSVLFLERDVPWYASSRDLVAPDYCELAFYRSIAELREEWSEAIEQADAVIVGSYVPQGPEVIDMALSLARGTTAFYDIDTPVTLARLLRGDMEYIRPDQVRRFDHYLSFSGGQTLNILRRLYRAQNPVAFHCCVDPDLYEPEAVAAQKWDLGYLGTYSDDRQPQLDNLMLEAARMWRRGRFAVAGPQYPETIDWPANVERIEHLPPALHRQFYNSQRFTLNITRADMVRLGHSPSVRLFEAAACGIPIITDGWEGLDAFFKPDRDILVSDGPDDTLHYLRQTTAERARKIGTRARARVLAAHTSDHRAAQLQALLTRQPVRV